MAPTKSHVFAIWHMVACVVKHHISAALTHYTVKTVHRGRAAAEILVVSLDDQLHHILVRVIKMRHCESGTTTLACQGRILISKAHPIPA